MKKILHLDSNVSCTCQSTCEPRNFDLDVSHCTFVKQVYKDVLPTGIYHEFQFQSDLHTFQFMIQSRPLYEDEQVLLNVDDWTTTDFFQSRWFPSQHEQGKLEYQLKQLVSIFRNQQFKEELMQRVFHPTKIEQRLSQGLSVEDAFYT